MGGTHWICFYIKDNKTFYFDSFGGQSDKSLLNQSPQPIIYPKYKTQDLNSRVNGDYGFLFLSNRKNGFYVCILETSFGYLKKLLHVLGKSSTYFENKIVISPFVQKPYWRTNFVEIDIE